MASAGFLHLKILYAVLLASSFLLWANRSQQHYFTTSQPSRQERPTFNEAQSETEHHRSENPFTPLPPPIAPSLTHFTSRAHVSEPYDWKHPLMVTAVGIPEAGMLKLAVISAGVHLPGLHRTFHYVGCLVGNKTYPRIDDKHHNPTFCLVDPNIPTGAHISLLLRRDEIIYNALKKPLTEGAFTIKNTEDDFLKLPDHVFVDQQVRQLAEGYEIVTIKSNVTWHEGLRERAFKPENKRFELCIMTANKLYPFLMQEYFDYYRRLGVDQMYVYDNLATEDLSQFDSDFVQTVLWPFDRSLYESYNHFLLISKSRCKYAGIIDVDEYTFVGDMGPNALKRFVRRKFNEGYDQIRFPFVNIIGRGYIHRPKGFLPDLYVRSFQRTQLKRRDCDIGKTIFITDANWTRHMIHSAHTSRNMYANCSMNLNPTSPDDNPLLIHYTLRSWEEVVLKKRSAHAAIITSTGTQNLSMEHIPDYFFSNDSTVEYLTFRDRWRDIMKLPYSRDFTLTWQNGDKECRQQYCVACDNDTKMEEEICTQIWT